MNRLLLLAPRIATNRLWARAGEVPSFHIAPARTQNARDLMTGGVLGTYNSASPAWAVGPDGVLFQPAANAPVIEYDPVTGACLGARIWGAVTNQIRNNSMVGAVAGTPGTLPTNWTTLSAIPGITVEIVNTGIFRGINYIDLKLTGTSSASSSYHLVFDANTATAASTGQTWTSSSYLALVAGSFTNIASAFLRCTERASGGSFIGATEVSISGITSNLLNNRIAASRTLGATAAFVQGGIFLGVTSSGAAIDITLRIGLPQLEQSATMGPVVKTTTLAASSTADVWSITGADFSTIWNQSAVTMYADAGTPSAVPSGFPRVVVADDAATRNNQVQLAYYSAGQANLIRTAAGVQAEFYPSIFAQNYPKAALAVAADNIAGASNGAITGTDNAAIMPTVDRLLIGNENLNINFLNGYIRELAIFRSRRPNTNLQAMTQ